MKNRQLLHRLLDEMLDIVESDPKHKHDDIDLWVRSYNVEIGDTETREDFLSITAELTTDIDDVPSIEDFYRTDLVIVNGGEKSNNKFEYDTTLIEANQEHRTYFAIEEVGVGRPFDGGIHEALCKAIHEQDEDALDWLINYVTNVREL